LETEKGKAMSVKTEKPATKTTAGSTKKEARYYTEGVIKDLWLESANDARFTLTPDSEYSIEADYKGEKKTCSVFRYEDFAERLCDNGVVDLYAGDYTFSAPKAMTFDQLLLIKVNSCHLRIYVDGKESLADGDTLDEGKLNRKSLVQVSEIRLKQK
jgi:hypothetical protein